MIIYIYYRGNHRYTVTGFIDKNKDPIYQDFKRLLYNRLVGVAVGVVNVSRMNYSPHLVSSLNLYRFIHFSSFLHFLFFLCCHSEHALLKEQWPEGAQAVTEVTKRPKSAGTRFKVHDPSLFKQLVTLHIGTCAMKHSSRSWNIFCSFR